jgi:hypothetical protein
MRTAPVEADRTGWRECPWVRAIPAATTVPLRGVPTRAPAGSAGPA